MILGPHLCFSLHLPSPQKWLHHSSTHLLRPRCAKAPWKEGEGESEEKPGRERERRRKGARREKEKNKEGCGRKRRGSGTRGGGSGRCSETGDAGVPVPCALSPEAVRGCTGASCGEGADFASGLEGCVSGRPGRRGAWGPGRVRGVRPQGSDPGGTPRACARGYAAPANQSPLAGFGSRTGLLPAQPAWQPAPTAFPSSGCRLVSGVASLLSQSASALQQPRWHREPPPCPLCTWEEVGLATACPEGRKELGVQRTEVANIKPLINLI